MLIALRDDNLTVFEDLVRQFAGGQLSHDELWAELETAFPDSCISNALVGSGI